MRHPGSGCASRRDRQPGPVFLPNPEACRGTNTGQAPLNPPTRLAPEDAGRYQNSLKTGKPKLNRTFVPIDTLEIRTIRLDTAMVYRFTPWVLSTPQCPFLRCRWPVVGAGLGEASVYGGESGWVPGR